MLKALIDNHWADHGLQSGMPTEALAAILQETIRYGENTVINDGDYLSLFGFPGARCEAVELGHHLLETLPRADGDEDNFWRDTIRLILTEGTLATRICKALRYTAKRSHIQEVYRVLCDCLVEGRLFEGID